MAAAAAAAAAACRPWIGEGGGGRVSGISRDTLSSITRSGYRDGRIDLSIRIRGIETARVRLIVVNSITSSSAARVSQYVPANVADFCARAPDKGSALNMIVDEKLDEELEQSVDALAR